MKNLKKYLAIFGIAYKNHTMYIYDTIWTNGVFVVRIVILIFLFKLIFATKWALTSGYSIDEISWALIFAQVLTKWKPRINEEINEEVKSGKIANYLLNPISYIWFKFFENFSRFFHNMISAIIIWLIIWFLFLGEIKTSLPGVLWWTLLMFWTMFISFFGYMMIGLFSFFVEDNEGFRYIYSKFDMLFWGNILPLPFLPPLMQQIAFLSPFAYAGYTVWLVFSKFNFELFLKYLALQIFWIIVLISICSYMYRLWRTKLVTNWW